MGLHFLAQNLWILISMHLNEFFNFNMTFVFQMMANLVTSSENKTVIATKIAKVNGEVSKKEVSYFIMGTPIHTYTPYYNIISFINIT